MFFDTIGLLPKGNFIARCSLPPNKRPSNQQPLTETAFFFPITPKAKHLASPRDNIKSNYMDIRFLTQLSLEKVTEMRL
jgi:hypothetical protein